MFDFSFGQAKTEILHSILFCFVFLSFVFVSCKKIMLNYNLFRLYIYIYFYIFALQVKESGTEIYRAWYAVHGTEWDRYTYTYIMHIYFLNILLNIGDFKSELQFPYFHSDIRKKITRSCSRNLCPKEN